MTDFDHTSLDRILPSTAGAPDWDDVLGRSRLHHGRRRRQLLLAAASTLVVAVVTASAIGSVREFVLDRGFIGLPPVGATPSAPESGELVLRFEGNSASHAWPEWRGGDVYPFVGAWVYADGRMIWWRDNRQVPEGANELATGYLEQRLTPEAVELLRSEVVGLLDHSRALLETVPPGDDPLFWPRAPGGLSLFVPFDYGSFWGAVEARDGDELVRLYWGFFTAKDLPHPHEGTIATPEQLSALRRIDALLTDPTSVLPSSAWAVREVRAYVPSHYAVCILSFMPQKDASYFLSLLPTRAADVLRDNRTRVGGLPSFAGGPPYCSKLTTEEAREVADAVSGLERDQALASAYSLVYRLAEGAHDGEETTISFDPYLPDGRFLFRGGPR
jgi:hypothetical protein